MTEKVLSYRPPLFNWIFSYDRQLMVRITCWRDTVLCTPHTFSIHTPPFLLLSSTLYRPRTCLRASRCSYCSYLKASLTPSWQVSKSYSNVSVHSSSLSLLPFSCHTDCMSTVNHHPSHFRHAPHIRIIRSRIAPVGVHCVWHQSRARHGYVCMYVCMYVCIYMC